MRLIETTKTLTILVVLLACNWGQTIAGEGPAMLPIFGKQSRCLDECGYLFTESATYTRQDQTQFTVKHPGWDFNLSIPDDNGQPVFAIADGEVVDAETNTPNEWGSVVIEHTIGGQTFYSQYGHCQEVFVIEGQSVKKGNRIGRVGGVPNFDPHLHWEIRSSAHPRASLRNFFGDQDHDINNIENVLSWYRDPEPFVANLNVDSEAAIQGASNVGQKDGNLDWWSDFGDGYNVYSGDNTAKNCYVQYYHNGNYGNCAIVFDALGGSRQAYTVRTGFWNNAQSNGWSQLHPEGQSTLLGPQGPLGMPITNEYNQGGSTARQDFQKGYLYYNGSTISVNTYTSPGWTSSDWINQYSYLFARAYERNGGRTNVGNAQGNVYSYGPYKRQDFSGGTYGNCCILYDPDNAEGNPWATNEAYLLRTGFYEYYFDGDGWQEFGCPSRDEESAGDPGDAIQFFVKRPGDGTTQQHHMYYDHSGNTIVWSSSYTTQWVTQDPNVQFDMARGATRTFTVKFKNTGQFTWHNNASSYPYDYVALKSCDLNGNVVGSFFYVGGLGWIDTETPCTMLESSVAPGDTATFTFLGKVATNASLGLKNIYFRPYHSTGGLISDRGGMHYVVDVISPCYANYDFDGNCIADYWDRTSTSEFHIDYAYNNLTGWDWTGYGYGNSSDRPCPADFDGDGLCDVAVLRDSDRKWLIDYAFNGFGAWDMTNLGGYGGYDDYPCPADYDGDGKDDISVRDGDGDWHIDYASNSFGGWDWTGYGYGGGSDRPCAADFDGDGSADLAILRDSDRKWLIDYAANGFGGWDVTNLAGYGGAVDYTCPADYDNDGIDDISVLNTTDRYWRVDRSANGFGGWDYVLGGYGGVGDAPIPADYDGDGWVDIACYHASEDLICLDYASNNYGSWDWCDGGAWHPTWKVAGETAAPITTSLIQNSPNPFNPTTSIAYSLTRPSHVLLEIYNVLGQRVTILIDDDLQAGTHTVGWDAAGFASGIYFYRLQTEDAVETKKMLFLK